MIGVARDISRSHFQCSGPLVHGKRLYGSLEFLRFLKVPQGSLDFHRVPLCSLGFLMAPYGFFRLFRLHYDSLEFC